MPLNALQKIILAGIPAVILALGENHVWAGPDPILLEIDDSDLSAVTITATAAHPIANSDTIQNQIGIDLENFFVQDQEAMDYGTFNGGSLIGGNSGAAYNDIWSDDYSTGGGLYYDLALYTDSASPGTGNLQNFSTSASAFTGTWTFDLASLGLTVADIAAPGSEGDILAGSQFDLDGNHTVIGTWQIMATPAPEPTTMSLMGMGVLALVAQFYRRR